MFAFVQIVLIHVVLKSDLFTSPDPSLNLGNQKQAFI